MITHYDLFAGIGGFSLALDEVFHNESIKHIFCEWEAFPTAVLKQHWPDGEYWGDIADLVAHTGSERLQRSKQYGSYQQGAGHKGQLANVLRSSLEASPASHLVTLDEDEERQITVISGQTCLRLFEMSTRNGSSLRTFVALLLGQRVWYSNKCALIWKAKATTSNRLLYQLSPLMRHTDETEYGLLPTAEAKNQEGYHNSHGRQVPKIGRIVTQTGQETGERLRLQPAFTAWMMGYPEGWTELPSVTHSGETSV